MSYEKEQHVLITLICDVGWCGRTYVAEYANSVPEARANAKHLGWRYTKTGRVTAGASLDVCPDHSEEDEE